MYGTESITYNVNLNSHLEQLAARISICLSILHERGNVPPFGQVRWTRIPRRQRMFNMEPEVLGKSESNQYYPMYTKGIIAWNDKKIYLHRAIVKGQTQWSSKANIYHNTSPRWFSKVRHKYANIFVSIPDTYLPRPLSGGPIPEASSASS